MPENTNRYNGKLPHLDRGEIIRVFGTYQGRGTEKEFEQFIKKVQGGYHVAMRDRDGEWVVDDVTDRYNPNTKFYDEWERTDRWPPVSDVD